MVRAAASMRFVYGHDAARSITIRLCRAASRLPVIDRIGRHQFDQVAAIEQRQVWSFSPNHIFGPAALQISAWRKAKEQVAKAATGPPIATRLRDVRAGLDVAGSDREDADHRVHEVGGRLFDRARRPERRVVIQWNDHAAAG